MQADFLNSIDRSGRSRQGTEIDNLLIISDMLPPSGILSAEAPFRHVERREGVCFTLCSLCKPWLFLAQSSGFPASFVR